MTNTLHRYGKAESFVDDYIVIAVPAKGKKSGQGDSLPALKRFLEIAKEYGPVNIGDALHGGALRPTQTKNPFGHFFARNKPDYKKVLETMDKSTTTAAVFDNKAAAEAFVARIRKEDFGVSINVSSSVENGLSCCKAAGVPRHSLAYSLGFEGVGDNIPNKHAILLSTMCGHGMIAQSLAKKMIDFVKEDRRTPDEAVASLQRFCSCGIFNPSRAKRIIEDAKVGRKTA
jgi:hypothetical protein